MPRARDPNRNRAFELYREYGGNVDLVEIASQLNISAGTVRGWKSKDDWDGRLNGTLQKKNMERSKKKGAQPGNKNAEGHGGTGPPGNKNAVKTGEFEALFFDTLDSDEQKLIQSVQLDKEQLLLQEIQLLTVREHRMLKRIENLKHAEFTTVKKQKGIEKDKFTDLKEDHATLGQIQAIEDALTRVQARRQKAIEALHKFGYDDARLELEIMRFELEMLKQGGQDENTDDDGFLDAMNAVAADVWGDPDE